MLLFSCTTFTSSEGPEWTRETPHHPGMAVFVGSGTGRDETAARAAAYMNVLEKLGSELGYDAVSPYYRELLSSNSIISLQGSITNTYTSPASEGVMYFAMFEMPESLYLSSRDAEYSASLERTDDIASLLESALSHYRNNEDTEALIASLNALDLSLSGPVLNDEFSPGILLDRAMEYLGNIKLEIGRDADGSSVSVRMKRARGLLHPDVVNGLVSVEYPMVNGDGDDQTSSVVLRTDRKGNAEFFRTNPYMLWEGTLTFSVYIPPSLLDSIESKAFEGFLNPFYDLLSLRSVKYSYRDESKSFDEETVIAIADYDEEGSQMESSPSFPAFSSYLQSASTAEYLIVMGYGEEERDVLSYARRAYPGLGNYIIVRSGIVDRTEGAERSYSRAESMVSFYGREGESPYIVRTLSTAGGGENPDAAGKAALERAGMAAAGMLLSEL